MLNLTAIKRADIAKTSHKLQNQIFPLIIFQASVQRTNLRFSEITSDIFSDESILWFLILVQVNCMKAT